MNPALEALRNGGQSEAYKRRMFHDIPDAPVVDRAAFLLERCAGKVVLDVGASGAMHAALVQAAKACHGIDRHDGEGVVGVDLDDYHAALPRVPGVGVVVCGEVLEHLSNPGWFLDRLRAAYPGVPVIVTVPNAFTEAGARRVMAAGVENVNEDHVAWYSYKTLSTLLGRHGYAVKEWYWYGGRPRVSEGLIAVAG
jgi:hypothetical protein